MRLDKKIINFYKDLTIKESLPADVQVLNPYRDKTTLEVCKKFYAKYYGDRKKRFLILGINPGRFGAGLTGIPFIDPVKLSGLGIESKLQGKSELSADFIHAMIESFGGHDRFYSSFLISSVSPLGFTQGGKNINYYDRRDLLHALRPFFSRSLATILTFNVDREVVFCLGEGENFTCLSRINKEEKYFRSIVPLAHPRFIMQYKRKRMTEYIEDYVRKFNQVLESSS